MQITQVLLAFSISSPYLCGMEKEIDTFEPFRFEIPDSYLESIEQQKRKGFLSWIDEWLFTKSIVVPLGFNKRMVCHATGMSYNELNAFLEKHRFESTGKIVTYEALEVLEKWYIKKLKRYLRNALSTDLESEEKATFLEFCRRYRKQGIKEVKSWKDIDEELILMEFRANCEGAAPSINSLYDQADTKLLFARIYKSYLFHTRFRASKHRHIALSVISFIISHHYHIFTTEADATTEATNTVAIRLIKKWFNPPRRVILYGLAS